MSNRTLIEINHDFYAAIDSPAFQKALLRLIRHPDQEAREALEDFGVRVFGTRHHSNAFSVDFGGVKHAEPESAKR